MYPSKLAKFGVLALLVATLSVLGVTLAFAEENVRPAGDVVAAPTAPPVVFVSSSSNGRVDGLRFRDEDIVKFVPDNATGTSGTWSMFFDGSDVGLAGTDVNAFEISDDGSSIYMSFERPVRIPNLGRVDDSDIVKFTYTGAPGDPTIGQFEMCFDGSEFDLRTSGEDVDSIGFDENKRLLISTTGTARVNGRDLRARDDDVIAFSEMPFDCNPTSGTWEIYVDGSDLVLNRGSEDIDGIWVDTSVPENNIYLTTKANFRAADGVNGIGGDGDDIFGLSPFTLGENNTTGFLFAAFDGDNLGFRKSIDGFFMAPVTALTASAATSPSDSDNTNPTQFEVEADDVTADDADDAEIDTHDVPAEFVLAEDEIVGTQYLPLIMQ